MRVARKLTDKYTWRVWIAAWYVLVFTIGLVAIVAGPFVGDITYRALSALPVGAGVGLAAIELAKLVAEIRTERLHRYLPEQVEFLHDNDAGEQVVAVTRGNGEHLIVTLPSGYHPEQDGGLAIVEQACPAMPKGMREAWRSAAVEIGLRRLLEDE